MYIVQNNSPGKFINLDHVAVMDWDKELTTEFFMANGQTITWIYSNEDFQMEDLETASRFLYDTDMLISVELAQE